jgi:hypothetical protein
MVLDGEHGGGISSGRITIWRRIGGKQWQVTVHDLGRWITGEVEREAEERP